VFSYCLIGSIIGRIFVRSIVWRILVGLVRSPRALQKPQPRMPESNLWDLFVFCISPSLCYQRGMNTTFRVSSRYGKQKSPHTKHIEYPLPKGRSSIRDRSKHMRQTSEARASEWARSSQWV
jgi:hypothetical protein